MQCKYNNYLIFVILICVYLNTAQISNEYTQFCSLDCQTRFGHFRCLQQYPQADAINYKNSKDTHCFLQCFLYKSGLMHLKSRGLDKKKFQDIWYQIEEAFEEDACVEKINFAEPLSGKCVDYYGKLMEFRSRCLELFEYTFTANSSWKSQQLTKAIGQSATEFCETIDGEHIVATETSQEEDISLVSQYKDKLQCVFQNFHYLDAYGRVDESEIILSYQEANVNTAESLDIIKKCCHQANSKFQHEYYGDMVWELQNCLKKQSPMYRTVYQQRDELSRQY